MKYNEWRDELKNNLLSVTDAERKRVLDYYAEAYADRRDAGFSEDEIIDDFGAPYDAAQRILCDVTDDYYDEQDPPSKKYRLKRRERQQFDEQDVRQDDRQDTRQRERQAETVEEPAACAEPVEDKSRNDYTWIFVLLCIIFSIPLFGLVVAMLGVTVGICVAPFAMLASGIGAVGAGILELFSNYVDGLWSIGGGLVVVGVSVILIPFCIKLVKLMWKGFKKFFRWVRSLFSGKKECKQ